MKIVWHWRRHRSAGSTRAAFATWTKRAGPIDIIAIVTVSDNGGSTGVLREAFSMPAMGDIRKCMIALAPEQSVLTSVCEHRFDNPASFAGHSLGNLILSALYQMSGSFAEAVRQACDLLELRGRVLPATEAPVTLCALYEDGGVGVWRIEHSSGWAGE